METRKTSKKQNAGNKPVCLIPTLSNTESNLQPRKLKDHINKIAKELGHVRIFALSSKSTKGNFILQLTNKTTRDFFRDYEDALKKAIGLTSVLEDDSCFKVVVHSVNTQEFNSHDSFPRVREEIETYNRGIKLTTDAIWLTSQSKRLEQQGASILNTVQTKEETNTAIRYRLFIGGIKVRAEFAKDKQREP
jgi:hypothetical protein